MQDRGNNWRIFTLTVIFLLSILPGFAGGQRETEEMTAGSSVTATDLRGREVAVKTPVERIVVTFNFEEVIAVLGGENPFDRIVGWSRGYWEGRRQSKWDRYRTEFPCIEDIADVGYVSKGTLSVEKILVLEPDLVISWISEYDKDTENYKRLEAAGIPIGFVDFHSETVESHTKSIMMLGKLLGSEDRAGRIIGFYRDQVEPVFSRIEGITDPKPRVYVEFGGAAPYRNTYGSGFMWGGIVEACGGENISAEALGNTNGPIDPEYFIRKNPEVVIICGRVKGGDQGGELKLGLNVEQSESRAILKNISKRDGWDVINAALNKRIFGIYHANSRHIYDFYGFQLFAKWFYPEHFADMDPEKNLREFYNRFMPIAIDDKDTFSIALEE